MSFTTIESSELTDKGVSSLSDTPEMEASDLKERFDSLGNLAISKFQTHIREIEAETGAGSVGAKVPAGLNASTNTQSIIDAIYLLVKTLNEYHHNHGNKDVLDLITDDVKQSYDDLATLFNTITEVENVVTDSPNKIPTSAAIMTLTRKLMLEGVPGEKGDQGVEQQIVIDSAVTSYTIKPNILYVFPEESALAITFDETGIDTSVVNDYHFTFVNGSTACELDLPASVNIGDLEIQPNSVCEISIVNNLLSFKNWSTV